MCEGEGKEYASLDSLTKSDKNDLSTLEKTLSFKTFLTGSIISLSDVEAFDNLELLNLNITKENFPNIYKWKKEIERMKLNWKLSKKPISVKGKTFKQYIEIITEQLNQKEKEFNEKKKVEMKLHENILKPKEGEKEKEIATIHFFTKKNLGGNYLIKILIKFLPDDNLCFKDVAAKILIICKNYFVNKTEVEEYKEKEKKINGGDIKEGVCALIVSSVNNEDYNIEKLAQELKRNIAGICQVCILSIDKNE